MYLEYLCEQMVYGCINNTNSLSITTKCSSFKNIPEAICKHQKFLQPQSLDHPSRFYPIKFPHLPHPQDF